MANEEENSSAEIRSFESNLYRDVSSLFLNQKFADVCFMVGSQKIYAHKLILAVRSEYFEALLYGGLNESKQTEIPIKDVTLKVFKMLLKYIYTDEICVTSSNIDLVMEVFALANKYCMKNLQDVITSKLKSLIDLHNVCSILNMANLYLDTKLKDACHLFLEENPTEFLQNGVHDLTQESLFGIMQRDTFYAPEIDIFRAITTWLKDNEDPNNLLISCVRLCWLSVDEILRDVRPTNIFTETELLDAIAEIRKIILRKTNARAVMVPNKNMADLKQGAKLLAGFNDLNYSKEYKQYFICHNMNDNITIKLQTVAVINHIRMILDTASNQDSSYYVEVSLDETNWEKIVDHARYPCRSVQNLFFENTPTRYIRIVGTSNASNTFSLACFEAFYATEIPQILNNFVRPNSNVATAEHGATVIAGGDRHNLLNGDIINYTPHAGYARHLIKYGENISIQLAQPFLISSMKLLLWDLDDRYYKYYIEVSVDNRNWEIVVDNRNENCRSWQNIRFEERPVVFIRITGTANTANDEFHCVHFECPGSEQNAELNSAEE